MKISRILIEYDSISEDDAARLEELNCKTKFAEYRPKKGWELVGPFFVSDIKMIHAFSDYMNEYHQGAGNKEKQK